MTAERKLERLIAHLRSHVAELRRMERDGAGADEVDERRRVIRILQDRLAYAVRDVLSPPGPSLT